MYVFCRDRDSNIPNVVAAVDCVVLEMHVPRSTKFKDEEQTNISSQFCRKGYFAVTLLAFVDAHMRFLSASITCGSSSHDSTQFAASNLGHLLSLPKAQGGIGTEWVVLGDDAFKALPHVMTPFQKQWLTNEQKNFNYCLSKLRSCVERAFGLWKGKWGIFWRPLRVSQINIPKVVEVTCRLHNLCINRHVSDNLEDFVVADDVFWRRTCSDAVRAKYIRSGRSLPEAPQAQPPVRYADAASINGIIHGVPSAEGMRRLRKEAMNAIAAKGVMRRISRLPPKVHRVAVTNAQGSVRVVGDLSDAHCASP
jgi:hypothetical protein